MVMVGNKKRILLIELAGIGDVVLSSPAIRNLDSNFPESLIYLLTLSGPAELMRKSPYLDKVFTLGKGFRSLFPNIRAIYELRKLHIDVVISLYQHFSLGGAIKIALLLKFIKPSRTFGRNTDNKGFFYDVKLEDYRDSQLNEAENKLALIKLVGCNIKDKKLEIWFDDFDIKEVKEFFNVNSILDSDLLIGINPGAHRHSHRWGWDNFLKVAEALTERYRAKIIITGTKDERWLAEKISLKMTDKPIISSGKLTVTQLIALIKRCNLYITNDTGPMHIANALGTSLVAIMGPGTMKTAPYQKENCIILRKEVECAPCYKFRCNDMKCLNLITVDEVIEACGKLLER